MNNLLNNFGQSILEDLWFIAKYKYFHEEPTQDVAI